MTTELYDSTSGDFSVFDPLPQREDCHNLINLNDTHIMLVGGDGASYDSVFFYNKIARNWTIGEKLNYERSCAAAGLVTLDDGSSIVVVTGGDNQANTEVFDFTTETWTEGPRLPAAYAELRGAESVQYGNTFLIVGGTKASSNVGTNTILTFDPVGYDWVQLPYEMQYERRFFTAFFVPDDFISCS